jgi:hypothetical protein
MTKIFKYSLILLILYKLIKHYFSFKLTVKKTKIVYFKYIEKEDPVSHFIRGCLAVKFQNFRLAYWHFLKFKASIEEKSEVINYHQCIDININFCIKPIPFVKKPINKSGSFIFYLLIELLGNTRMTNYEGIYEDLDKSLLTLNYFPTNIKTIDKSIDTYISKNQIYK